MSPALWAVGGTLGILFIVGACDDTDPPKEAVPAPTVTVSAVSTVTPDPVVSTVPTVPDHCSDAIRRANDLYDTVSAYEHSIGGISEVHDLTATGIASHNLDRINEARAKFGRVMSNSTDNLQQIVSEMDSLQIANKLCRSDLSQ
jgi:hypothetical protein